MFDPAGLQVIRTALDASWWINEQMEAWLGEKNAVDTLTQSVTHNVTSEMGLALLDVADAIRPHPDVVAFLAADRGRRIPGQRSPTLAGGQAAKDAIQAYLDTYGMRCIGEIDITRPRWSEHPSTLVPMILSNVKNFEPGEADAPLRARPARGAGEGAGAPASRAGDAGRRVQGRRDQGDDRSGADLHRIPGVPEVPHGQPLLRLQAGLVARGRTPCAGARPRVRPKTSSSSGSRSCRRSCARHHVDDQLIAQRRDAMQWYRALTPPRVLTSEGEVVGGEYRRDDVPAGALVGLPVSAGTVEGTRPRHRGHGPS